MFALIKPMRSFLLLCLYVCLEATSFAAEFNPNAIRPFPVLDVQRLKLTRNFAMRHYNMETYALVKPKMIVVHYASLSTIALTLGQFLGARIPDHREKLVPFGAVNVGVHYVIDTDGTIYSVLPTTIMGRHTAGYDYTSIGIENVGSAETELTAAQARSNADLIAYLSLKHPTIRYLIGHHEYMNKSLPHFYLFRSYDPKMDPPIKIDPGWGFMQKIRGFLRQDYSLEFQN